MLHYLMLLYGLDPMRLWQPDTHHSNCNRECLLGVKFPLIH